MNLRAMRDGVSRRTEGYHDPHGLKPIGEAVAIAQAKVMEKEGWIPSVDLPVVNPTRSTPGN